MADPTTDLTTPEGNLFTDDQTRAATPAFTEALARNRDARDREVQAGVANVTARQKALEAVHGLAPQSPVDGQTSNLIAQPGTLTRSALNAATAESISARVPPLVLDSMGEYVADMPGVAEAAAQRALTTQGVVTGAANVLGGDAFGALTDDAGNLSPFAWTREGHLHHHSARVIGKDAAGVEEVGVLGVQAMMVDDADNIIMQVMDDGRTIIPGLGLPETGPAPAPPGAGSTLLPAPDLANADMTRWSWWGSSTMAGMASRYQTLATAKGATLTKAGGNSGESAEHTLSRLGARPAITAEPFTIPASGPVDVALANVQQHWGAYSAKVAIGGVPGTLSKLGDGSTNPYRFTRTTAGTAVAVAAGTPFVSTDGATFRSGLILLNIGKNNLTGVSGTRTVGTLIDWTVQAYNYAAHLSKRVLVMGHWHDRDSTPNILEWPLIDQYNARARDLFGEKYMDLQAMVTSPDVWTITGFTPTQADLDHQAAGRKPPSISSDSLHLNAAGLDLMAAKTETKLTSLGWIN